MRLMRKRKIWFLISAVMIVPGLISLMFNGLKLSIDFTGGSLIEVSGLERQQAESLVSENGFDVLSTVETDDGGLLIRMKDREDEADSEDNHQKIKEELDAITSAEERRFETVGPSISADITRKAFISIIVAIIAIVFYVSYSFRKVPQPASSFRFAISTIAALVHDVLVLVGSFSILGWLFGMEVDSLFVTAALTVIGFSVHDTIVVFDRIRENLKRHGTRSFEEVVDVSLTETFARSMNTSFTVILVLLALFFFGGATVKPFILAIVIGVFAGTYSSIFNAAPVLVVWQNWRAKRAG